MTLIIDGHNLIGTRLLPGIQLGDADDEWQLVQRLRSYAVARKLKLTVVFDSGPGAAPNTQPSGSGVQVRFAPPGVEADAVILQLVRAGKQPGRLTVVTDDRTLSGLVRAAGGQVRSASQFARELVPGKQGQDQATAPELDPRDPAFADIYRGFQDIEKDAVRFGGDIALDPEVWIERLYGSDVDEAGRAAHWLGRFGGAAAFEPLTDALTHRHSRVRAGALLALGNLGDRSAVPAAAERLDGDSSTMVREAAVQCLTRLGGPAAEAALEAALSDPRAKVRKAAESGLAQLRAR